MIISHAKCGVYRCLCIAYSYKGHRNEDYKVDSCLTHDDAHIVSGSEDGQVCFWDLVEVPYHNYTHITV